MIHRGFDGLDLAYKGHIDLQTLTVLTSAKQRAQELKREAPIVLGNMWLKVSPKGRRGFEFIVLGGDQHETWFFKKPNANDPYGVYVSVAAIRLASKGLAATRLYLEDRLRQFGIEVEPGDESIARVDYAVDYLFPEFAVSGDHFSMSSAYSLQSLGGLQEYREKGKTSRIETVMIGKNPNAQVEVYDKTTEVKKRIATRGQSPWPTLWGYKYDQIGLPPLDFDRPETSQIWRIELRAYKKHLKEKWKVSTWGDLQEKLWPIFEALIKNVRLTIPSADSNRSRWPTHPLWRQLHDDVLAGLAKEAPCGDNLSFDDRTVELKRKQLKAQLRAFFISLAGLHRIALEDLPDFARAMTGEVLGDMQKDPERTRMRLEQAFAKYATPENSSGMDQ